MNRLSEFLKTENNTFHEIQRDIDAINYLMLRIMLVISLIVLTFLTTISFFIDDFVPKISLYIYPMTFSLLLLLLFWKRPTHKVLLSGFYLFITVFVVLCLYLNAIVSPESQGASIIGVLLLVPLIVIDKAWRTSLFSLLFYMTFVLSSFIFKDYSIALDDMMTGFAFVISGNVLGYYMRSIKLVNIANQHRLKTLSDTDGLTRLLNRRKLDMVVKRETDYNAKGVIMIDVDFFKRYNDEYGHQAGDACLEEVGATLQRVARLYHIRAYRYGGEEFVLLSDHHTYDELYVIANEVRREIKRLQISFDSSPFKTVTITAGVSEAMICSTHDIKNLIKMADKALYHGKTNGRNIVVGYTLGKR